MLTHVTVAQLEKVDNWRIYGFKQNGNLLIIFVLTFLVVIKSDGFSRKLGCATATATTLHAGFSFERLLMC